MSNACGLKYYTHQKSVHMHWICSIAKVQVCMKFSMKLTNTNTGPSHQCTTYSLHVEAHQKIRNMPDKSQCNNPMFLLLSYLCHHWLTILLTGHHLHLPSHFLLHFLPVLHLSKKQSRKVFSVIFDLFCRFNCTTLIHVSGYQKV